MGRDPASPSDSLPLQAYGFYRALIEHGGNVVACESGSEPSLGGQLLYAGELDGSGCSIVVAGNVAGCATLAASGDALLQRDAIRDGIVDFLVNSLDEALRILKNEIRKREPVAVCVGVAPEAVEQEMIERGVLPDFVFTGLPGEEKNAAVFGGSVCRIEAGDPDPSMAFISWQTSQSPGRRMQRLDSIVMECLGSDGWTRRWIRLSSRYCGRASVNRRALYCDPETAKKIAEHLENAVRGGQVDTEVLINLRDAEGDRVVRVAPSGGPN